MEPTGATLLLLARLLLTGPEGTRALSDHRAAIPVGATGLLRETLHEENLPGAIALHVTPQPGTPASTPESTPQGNRLLLRAELWSDPEASAAGRPPDEVDTELIELAPGASSLVQLAEDPVGRRRLFVSLTVQPEAAGPPVATAIPSGHALKEVAFRIDAYRDRGGVRDLLSTHLLRTLEGLPVSCQTSWKALAPSGPRGTPPPEEELTLTLRPLSPQEGWISVEASLTARILAETSDSDPIQLSAKETRTVSLGLPFELSVQVPSSPESNASKEEGGSPAGAPSEMYVIQIVPFLP